MTRYQQVAQIVEQAYISSDQSFAQFMWAHHVPTVAQEAERLS